MFTKTIHINSKKKLAFANSFIEEPSDIEYITHMYDQWINQAEGVKIVITLKYKKKRVLFVSLELI